MITFLSSPKAFTGINLENQINAIRSWLSLAEEVEVILYGKSEGIDEVSRKLGVKYVSDIATSEYGTPLFGAIANHAAQQARYDLQAYVNCDILLNKKFINVAKSIPFPQFLMVGQRIDLAEGIFLDVFAADFYEKFIQLAQANSVILKPPNACDYFVFRRNLWEGLPSLVIGRAGYDNALIGFCLKRSVPVVDATFSIIALHQYHDYMHVPGGQKVVLEGSEAMQNKAVIGRFFSPNITDATWQWREGRLHRAYGRGDWLRVLERYLRFRLCFITGANLIHLLWWVAYHLGILKLYEVKLPAILPGLIKDEISNVEMKDQVRVCQITTVHRPFDVRIFHKESKTLAKAGYKVTLIAQYDKDELIDGIQIIALPKALNRFHRICWLMPIALCFALKQRADVYHIHDPELLLVATLLKILTNKKIIYDIHENVEEQILIKHWLPKWSRRLVVYLYSLSERLFLLLIDYVILACDSFIKNYSGITNIMIIRNLPILSLSNETIRRKDDDKTVSSLIYLGAISRERGVFELIEMVKILKNKGYVGLALKLVGPLHEASLLPKINKLLESYGIVGNIEICGAIPHNRIYAMLSQAQIGFAVLHPASYYKLSFPTKIFEYMAAGIAVVASKFPKYREVVEGNKCGVCVDPLNPKEIAQAVEYLIKQPKEREEMGENGRRAVMEKYNWESEGKKLIELYHDIFKNKEF
jgi:glycosyltransferase involved in cell wall biosynthesis